MIIDLPAKSLDVFIYLHCILKYLSEITATLIKTERSVHFEVSRTNEIETEIVTAKRRRSSMPQSLKYKLITGTFQMRLFKTKNSTLLFLSR